MSARRWAAAAVLVLLLAHLATPYLAVLITVEVLAFALTCAALGWLLASARAARLGPVAAPGKAGPR